MLALTDILRLFISQSETLYQMWNVSINKNVCTKWGMVIGYVGSLTSGLDLLGLGAVISWPAGPHPAQPALRFLLHLHPRTKDTQTRLARLEQPTIAGHSLHITPQPQPLAGTTVS